MKQMFESIEDVIELKTTKRIHRLGTIFHTKNNAYIYDTGTGKVIQLDSIAIDFFVSLFNESTPIQETYEYWKIIPEELQKNIIRFLCDEYLLQCPFVKNFSIDMGAFDSENIKIQQLILEVTGMCNMRCKYCIYNEYNEGNRDFNTNNMSFETAKKH